MEELRMELGPNSYDILLQKGLLDRAGELLSLDRQVLIVTDGGVPRSYAARLARQCRAPVTVRLPQGEQTKRFGMLQRLLRRMLRAGFTRESCVVALGGGVVGDLAGFAASCYMRGIDFYNIPTTLLSQVDSSIGGKVAIDFEGVKNIVGAFYQPRRVLIDPQLLSTLPPRQLANGLAEVIKAGVVAEAPLLALLEQEDALSHLDQILLGALRFKKRIVEQDERESGPRKLLNFGHTIGHGIESVCGISDGKGLLHGECVGLGMLPMCTDPALRLRVEKLLERYGLLTHLPFDPNAVFAAVCHDKKSTAQGVTVVIAEEAGGARLKEVSLDWLHRLIEREAEEGIGR